MTEQREAEIRERLEQIQTQARELAAENDPFNEPHLEFLEGWYWELRAELAGHDA